MNVHTLPAWLIAKHAQAVANRPVAIASYAGIVIYRNPACVHAYPAIVQDFAQSIDSIDAHDNPSMPDIGASDDAPEQCDDGAGFTLHVSD